jgi:hypothetical protein
MTPTTALEVATMPTRGCDHVSNCYSKMKLNEGAHTSALVQIIASNRIRAFRFFPNELLVRWGA